MTTYNTGNPIGSTDSRDRLDNTENMDYLENSTTELTHADRLGTVRKTRHGMEVEHDAQIAAHETEHDAQIAAHESEHDAQMQSFENDFDSRLAGMAFTRVGTFNDGYTLTDMRQTLLWGVSQGGDGHEYGWAGTFPKVVAAGSTPATSGGIGAGAWVDRTDETLRSNLSSNSGASLVGFMPAGNGAVATTVQSKLREFVSVKDFGAVGDGVADDTIAIQAALDAGKRVYFPEGVYLISDSLQIYAEQEIYGNATVKLADGNYTYAVFMMTNTVKTVPYSYDSNIPQAKNIRISGLTFDGNSANATSTSSVCAIFFDQVDFGSIIDVTVLNTDQGNGGLPGIRTFYSNNCAISRCSIQNTDRQGIGNYESSVSITDCYIAQSKEREPIIVSASNPPEYREGHSDIARCTLINTVTVNGTHVVRFSSLSSGSVKDCTIVGTATLDGIYITDIEEQNVELENNVIKDCEFGVLVESNSLRYVRLRGNKYENCVNGIRYNADSLGGTLQIDGEVIDSTNVPIYVNYVDNVIIKNCTIQGGVNCSVFNTQTAVIADNIFTGLTNASYSLLVTGSEQTTPFVVQGNIAVGNTSDLLRIDANAAVDGNSARLTGQGAGEMHVGSIGDHYIWGNGGKLYIKAFSFPANPTDGTIVGTQT